MNDPNSDDGLFKALEGFISRYEEDPSQSPESYVAGCPRHLQDQLRSLCHDYIETASLLAARTTGASTAGTNVTPMRIGPYELKRRLGAGGLATVHLAVHQGTGETKALKILHQHLTESYTQLARFRSEYDISTGLRHPNIIGVEDFGDDEGMYYLVMSQVMVTDLGALLEKEQGPLSVKHAVELVVQVCSALAFLHDRGIVHRDIKPQNILLDEHGTAYLADLGLAQLENRLTSALTKTGQLVGTPYYMSPEQARARRFGVDHRTDIYSLGTVLYELLTSQKPFCEGSVDEVLYHISFLEPAPPSSLNRDIPYDLETICLKALEKNPAHRYSNASDMGDDLKRFDSFRAIGARRPRTLVRALRRLARHKLRVAALSSLLAGVSAAVFGTSIYRDIRERQVYIDSLPTLQIATDDRIARAFLQELDAVAGRYGDPDPLTSPTQKTPIEKGYYRITVVHENGEFTEITRWVWRERETLEINPTFHATETVTSNMVLIPSGPFVAGLGPASYSFPEREAFLPAFYIDRYEVTNRQYKEFAEATKRDAPGFWKQGYQNSWDDLPVVGVSSVDARDFAEWTGKRLPTRLEWERTARFTDGRAFPWGDDKNWRDKTNVGFVTEFPADNKSWFPFYLRYARVGGFYPEDVTVEGVFDMLGNVSEWVDGPFVAWHGGRADPIYARRAALGLSWKFRGNDVELKKIHELPLEAMLYEAHVGFRCAKSAAPLP